jgi:steroid delta-isomerase-like uncharacterized protein
MAETETKPRTRRPTKAKQVEQTIRSYFEAAGRRDIEAMASFYHPDVVLDIVPMGIKRGAGEYRAFFEEVFAAFPDVEFTISRLVTSPSLAAVEWRMRGTFTGRPFQGIEASGRTIELRGCDLFEVEDGKIVSNTGYYDGMAFARAVGMMPPQDSGAERAMTQAFNAITKVRRAVQERR